MDEIVNLTLLLKTMSNEPNAAIRQAAETQLQSAIDLRPETHDRISQFILTHQEENTKILLLVFVKRMFANEQTYAYSKSIQDNLKRISEIYRNLLFVVPLGNKKSQIISEILMESLHLVTSQDYFEEFEAQIWNRIANYNVAELSAGLFALRVFYKGLQSKLFGSSFAIAGRLEKLVATGEFILQDLFSSIDASDSAVMTEESYFLVYEYIKILKLLRNGFTVIEEAHLNACLNQLIRVLSSNFKLAHAESQKYSDDLEFVAYSPDEKIAIKISQIKTLTLKVLKYIDKKGQSHYVKVTQSALIYASAQLSHCLHLQNIPAQRADQLNAYLIELLELLNSKIENIEFNNFYSGSLGAIASMCIKLIMFKGPSFQLANSDPVDYLDILEDALGQNSLSTVLNATTTFFIALCDRYDHYPLSAFNFVKGKLSDCFAGNLQSILEFGGDPVMFTHAALLLLAAMHVTLNMKSVIISDLANFILEKKEQLTSNIPLYADLILLFKVYASDFVEENKPDNQGHTAFFNMLELLLTNFRTKPSELIELSSSRAIEYLISRTVLDESPSLEVLLAQQADLIFTRLAEIYLADTGCLKGDLVRNFYKNFGKKISFQSVADMIGVLNAKNFKELESNVDNLIDLAALFSVLITKRIMTPQESEYVDSLMVPFFNYFYDHCHHKDLLEDNICELLRQVTTQTKSCSKVRLQLLPKIRIDIERDSSLLNDYFPVLNSFLVFGRTNFDLTLFRDIFEIVIRNANKTLNIYLLCSLIQNLGHFFTKELFEAIFARMGMMVPDLASQANKDLQRGIVFVYINSLVFISHQIHDQQFSSTFFTVINSFVLNQNLFFRNDDRKIVCLALIALAKSPVYGPQYEQLMPKLIVSIYDHISMIDKVKETERLSAKKTKRVSQKVNRPLDDFSSSDDEDDEDERTHNYQAHHSQVLIISKFINVQGIPDQLLAFKEFCKTIKDFQPAIFEMLVKRLPIQVANFVKDIFSIEAVPIDKGATVFENRKIVRLKKKE